MVALKIYGLLNFFDEPPDLISLAIERVVKIGVDHLVCADGSYDLFPAKANNSPPECIAAIMSACRGDDGGCNLDILNKNFPGNEVEKRNRMLEHVFDTCGATDQDWLLVFDADHIWAQSNPAFDLKATLVVNQTLDAAEVRFADGVGINGPAWYEARLLLRAIPGMTYDRAHWRVRFPDGRSCSTLKAGDEADQVPTLDLTSQLCVWHDVQGRDPERRALQSEYYGHRDTEGVES